jgi:1-deoxy-D-xylulose-5-phosphate synthase
MNEHELRNLMFTAQKQANGPFVIRYPRGRGVLIDWRNEPENIPIGKGRKLNSGERIAVVSIGHPGNFVAEALQKASSEGLFASHYDMRFLKPLDEEMLHEVFSKHEEVITVEDGTIYGGMGSALIEFMNRHQYRSHITSLGIPERFVAHGKPDELMSECGYNAEAIYQALIRLSAKG